MKKLMKRFVSILCTVTLIMQFIVFYPINSVTAASDTILSFDWNLIETIGRQPSGSYSCSCYSMAYCRSILDGYAHNWSEYNEYNNNQYNVWCMWGWGDYNKGYSSTELGTLQAIYNSLNKGRPAIVYVQGKRSTEHWVAVIGYTNDAIYTDLKVNNFLIIDPGHYSSSYENLGKVGYSLKKEGENYAYVYTNNGGVPFNQKVPSKPTLTITPGTSTEATTFTWSKSTNADWYDVRIWFPNVNDPLIYWQCSGTSLSVNLPEGQSYWANVAPVNGEHLTYTFRATPHSCQRMKNVI